MDSEFLHEIKRKAFHMTSLWMPLAIYLLPTTLAHIVFGVLSIVAVGVEIGRCKSPTIAALVQKFFGGIIRAHEADKMSGATYMLIGAFIVSFFPMPAAVTGLCVLMIADSAAALIGKRYGSKKIYGEKSWAGCAAFLLSGWAIVLLLGNVFPQPYCTPALAGIVCATMVELFTKHLRLDDNLSIPVSFCLAYSLISIT